MAYNFISGDRGQKYLLPPSLLEWLPEGDLTWFILDAVEQRGGIFTRSIGVMDGDERCLSRR